MFAQGVRERFPGRPPRCRGDLAPVLCLVNTGRSRRTTTPSLPESGERLSLIGPDCGHSGQLGALPAVQSIPASKHPSGEACDGESERRGKTFRDVKSVHILYFNGCADTGVKNYLVKAKY